MHPASRGSLSTSSRRTQTHCHMDQPQGRGECLRCCRQDMSRKQVACHPRLSWRRTREGNDMGRTNRGRCRARKSFEKRLESLARCLQWSSRQCKHYPGRQQRSEEHTSELQSLTNL